MNANELADLVECACCAYQKEAAAMLRQFGLAESIIKQQQLEIEALKEALSMKVILNEHAQQSMKGYKELLK
jgi:polysaccharide pyruvyl transferase WcaK-like protein